MSRQDEGGPGPETTPGPPSDDEHAGAAALRWTGSDAFTVGGNRFRTQNPFTPLERPLDHDELVVFKPPELLEEYAALLLDLQPRNVFELGIFDGGSTVLTALLSNAAKLVAIDISPQPSERFARWLDREPGAVSTHFGVDQSDQDALRTIVAAEFDGAPLDLVIDDASHLLDPSRSSFDVLFPRLRPGGLYVVEDWTIAHEMERHRDETAREEQWGPPATPESEYIEHLLTRPPLTVLLFDAALSIPYGDIVDGVSFARHWAVVRRGSARVDPESFRLSDCSLEGARSLVNGL